MSSSRLPIFYILLLSLLLIDQCNGHMKEWGCLYVSRCGDLESCRAMCEERGFPDTSTYYCESPKLHPPFAKNCRCCYSE
ncbi:hypothetical protein vseg_011512 [Gypsophila vaccaria]